MAAFDSTVDEELFGVVARRWLGPTSAAASWSSPGAESTGHPTLDRRLLAEEARGLGHLRSLYLHAVCRLGQTPQSFGTQIPEGFLVAASACEALGENAGVERARKHYGALASSTSVVATSLDPAVKNARSDQRQGLAAHVAAYLVPQVREIELHGQKLSYPLLMPSHFDGAIELLRSKLDGDWADSPGTPSTEGVAMRAGTSVWLAAVPNPSAGVMPTAHELFGAAPAGQGRMAHLEKEVELAIQRWRAGLTQHSAEGTAELDAAARALFERWFRRSLYRDLGLLALDAGDAELALVNLEEAAEARGRVRPGAGLDPLLLLSLARARYESNELQRAVELLDDIGDVPGWEVAGHVARTVARVAVVGSAAEAKVSR